MKTHFCGLRQQLSFPIKNNNLKSIFNDVIQEINKITIDEKALPQDIFLNPYVACLEYLSKYGYSIKTIEWE